MPATAGTGTYTATGEMSWQQGVSLVVGLGLLFATLAGWWGALQANGLILGAFAFNGWTTALSLVAGAAAIWAGLSRTTSRAVWTVAAAVYALYAVIAAFMAASGGQVIGLFAANAADAWAAGVAAIVFAILAYTQEPTM